MALSTQPYKGTRDFYPTEMRFRRWMFGKMRGLVERYGYEEYDGPMLEPFELYAAKTGEEIVNQQLYWMMDRGERKIAVRPEMTPTMARMVAGKIQELAKPVRWYSIPNLWRYERPQRGRLREHWQLNVDVLGGDTLLADTEILTLALDLMKEYGGGGKVELKINHRAFMDHCFGTMWGLDAKQALAVIKAIDARDKIGEEKFNAWLEKENVTFVAAKFAELLKDSQSSFEDFAQKYDHPSIQHLKKVFAALDQAGFQGRYKFDPTVMRGMDYYTGTVFELYDTSPENNRAMFGGGRYDNLVGMFGNQTLSGVGFGMGDVTLQNFLETHKLAPEAQSGVDVVVTIPKVELGSVANQIAQMIRATGLKTVTPLEANGFGAQLKYANKVGARFAILLGDDELAKNSVAVKDLKSGEQSIVAQSELATWIQSKV